MGHEEVGLQNLDGGRGGGGSEGWGEEGKGGNSFTKIKLLTKSLIKVGL